MPPLSGSTVHTRASITMNTILLVALIAVLGAAVGRPQQDAYILEETNNFNGIDPWKWNFRTSNGIWREETGSVVDDNLDVQGSYSWTGPDGVLYAFVYHADKDGYRVQRTNSTGGGGLGINTQLSLIG